jgi:serine/threonine protein kinase
MDIQIGAIDRVLEDCVHVLKAIRNEHASDRKPYAVDLRRLLESGLILRFGEYLQFLEKYGFLKLDRRSDVLTLTRPGTELIDGKLSRSESLKGDASYHFGERLNEVSLGHSAASELSAPIDGRYLLHREIGTGALSKVSAGIQLSLNQPVAIKTFDGLLTLFAGGATPSLRRELRQAIEMNAAIKSHFVLSILDMNVDADVPYAVSELCAGGNLRTLMDTQTLTPDVALALFHQMALGLNAAHESGVVHGDLKPENILLTEHGNAKISDLGFMRLAQTDSTSQQRAYVGYASLGYLAPEMFRQDRTYTVSSDVYAMGIILYELLVGRLPGRRSPLPSLLVEGLPEGVDELFDSMADDDHDARIENMNEVLTRLDTILGRDDAMSRAEIFLSAPFELPQHVFMLPEVAPSSHAVSDGDDVQREDKQTQDVGQAEYDGGDQDLEVRGLETINSASLDPDEVNEEQTPEQAEPASQADSDEDSDEAQQAVAPAPETKVEPPLEAEPALPLDRREATEVMGPERTSMIDPLVDD